MKRRLLWAIVPCLASCGAGLGTLSRGEWYMAHDADVILMVKLDNGLPLSGASAYIYRLGGVDGVANTNVWAWQDVTTAGSSATFSCELGAYGNAFSYRWRLEVMPRSQPNTYACVLLMGSPSEVGSEKEKFFEGILVPVERRL